MTNSLPYAVRHYEVVYLIHEDRVEEVEDVVSKVQGAFLNMLLLYSCLKSANWSCFTKENKKTKTLLKSYLSHFMANKHSHFLPNYYYAFLLCSMSNLQGRQEYSSIVQELVFVCFFLLLV